MEFTIQRTVDVVRTPRVQQLEGMFDVPPSMRSEQAWRHRLDLPTNWNIGVIVGPSGSGKSTLAREAFGKKNWSIIGLGRGNKAYLTVSRRSWAYAILPDCSVRLASAARRRGCGRFTHYLMASNSASTWREH